MNKYTVLWIDDKHDTEAKTFKLLASNYGVKLDSYKSLNKGLEILEKKYLDYDAIILDGFFLENENDTPGTENIINTRKAIDRIEKLPKKIPYFLLSGLIDQNEDRGNALSTKRVYDRKSGDEQKELLKDLTFLAENQPEFLIKTKYSDILIICTDKYLGDDYLRELMEILKVVEGYTMPERYWNYLNDLRQIIESIFWSIGDHFLLPIELYSGEIDLGGTKKFLIKNDDKYKYWGNPDINNRNLTKLLTYTNEGSHIKNSLDNHYKLTNSRYNFLSLFFSLCEFIVWYKYLIDNNVGKYENKSKITTGTILKKTKENQNYGFLQWLESKKNNAFIHNKIMTNYELKEGDKLKCEVSEGSESFIVTRIFEINGLKTNEN